MPRAFWIGLPLGIAIAAVALTLIFRQEGEPLTAEALKEARSRWQSRGVQSYDLFVEVRGAQRGDHRIEVRNGRVTRMTTGGEPAARTAWQHWTIDGMFDFLATELDNAGQPGRAHDAKPGDVELRAAFDEEFGYPRRFLRHVSMQTRSIEWRIVSFEPR